VYNLRDSKDHGEQIKVLIINPPIFKVIEPYYDLPDYPRTALAFLAGYLRDNWDQGEVVVKDAKFDRLNFEQLLEFIKETRPDVIGITAMTNEIKAAGEVANLIKEFNKDIKTIIGGVHLTALPEETMREFPSFDFGVLGEGEVTFLELIKKIQQKQEPTIPGVCYLLNGVYKSLGDGEPLADQDSLRPAWDLFRPAKEYMIQSSRGCPFACNFCMNPGGRVVRPRSVETTLNEIEELVENMNPESIYFGDEIFTVKRNRAKEICEGLITRGLNEKVQWWCQTHVNTLDEELVVLMKSSGCKLVGLGIETGDDDIFKKMGKGINKEKVKKAINILKKHKLNYDTMFILGQPNETVISAKKTIDFAVKLNPTTPIFGLMVPYPGTQVGEMALKGLGGYKLLSKDWDQFNKQIGNALELQGITRKQLERMQFMGYIKVFLFNFRILDFIKFCLLYKKEGFTALKKLAFNH
jgi:anaerobic magnesium-protoporphyrin IX monomethyl ester cyclase